MGLTTIHVRGDAAAAATAAAGQQQRTTTFHADTALLLQQMPYFRSVLGPRPTPGGNDVLHVQCAAVFGLLLSYAKARAGLSHTQPALDCANAVAVLAAAHFLRMAPLVKACVAFVSRHLLQLAGGGSGSCVVGAAVGAAGAASSGAAADILALDSSLITAIADVSWLRPSQQRLALCWWCSCCVSEPLAARLHALARRCCSAAGGIRGRPGGPRAAAGTTAGSCCGQPKQQRQRRHHRQWCRLQQRHQRQR